MATLNLSMPDAMREWIDAQIDTGEYANASDYIRDLIQHDQRQRDSLWLALIEGEKNGQSSRRDGRCATHETSPQACLNTNEAPNSKQSAPTRRAIADVTCGER